jgi:hypothetical protein
LHNEYQTWMRELIFYKEEIKIFERHLETIIAQARDRKVAAQVEQFQNKFIREKEVIDELKHKLHISEKQLAGFVAEISGLGMDSIKMDNHPTLREDIKTFRSIFSELKHQFKKFELRNH